MNHKLFVLLMILSTQSYGQDTVTLGTQPVAPSTYTAKNAWHISALLPRLTYERRIGPQVTLVGEYGLGFIVADPVKAKRYGSAGSSWAGSGWAGSGWADASYGPDLRLNSKVSVGIRRYADFERRVKQGRSIRYNSSGYLMLKVGYHFAPFDGKGNVTFKPGIGPFIQGVWGFQRTYRKNLYLNLAAGPQLWYPGLSFGVDVGIGYTLPTSN